MSMSDSRERFERWILSVNGNDGHTIERIEPGEYRSTATDCAWEAWQASESERIAALDADLTQSVQMYVDAARERDEAIAAEIKSDAELAKVKQERDAGIARMRTAINMLDAGHTKEQVRVWLAGFQEGNAK